MKKITPVGILSVAIILLIVNSVFSDDLPISADLKLYGTYVDNIFQTNLPESDYAALTYLNTAYYMTPETSIFYDANINLFSEHSDLQNHIHYLGADYERGIFGDKGNLYLEGKLELRQNKTEYESYDRRSGDIYATLKYYLTKTILLKSGYGMEYGSYPNFQTFNFLENYGFLQLSKFFQSRTTLQIAVDAGWRQYPNMSDDSENGYASMISGSAKLAQSLADKTGLQLKYKWHHAPHGIDEQYIENAYYSTEDLIDDEYSYSGSEYMIVLKHVTSWQATLKAVFSMGSREYNSTSIYIDGGTRKDNDITFRLEAEKEILFDAADFAIHVQFLHKRNESNDSYYNYSTNMLSIGTKAAF